MWRKEEANSQVPEAQSHSGNAAKAGTGSIGGTPTAGQQSPACVSQGIKIKGEVTGTEDLFIDGSIEGKISLGDASVTVGPNGIVKAEITARELIFRGVAEGKFTAREQIQIWHTAHVQGDLKSEKISIEDGAEMRGKVEAGAAAKPSTVDSGARVKKTEPGKSETSTKDANLAPGTATAGAD